MGGGGYLCMYGRYLDLIIGGGGRDSLDFDEK